MDSVLAERWFSLSLVEQMVNIGNEVRRAVRFDNDAQRKRAFVDKAVEYTRLSMSDPKNARIVPELEICCEVLNDYADRHVLNCSKEQICSYYDKFLLMLQGKRIEHRAAEPEDL